MKNHLGSRRNIDCIFKRLIQLSLLFYLVSHPEKQVFKFLSSTCLDIALKCLIEISPVHGVCMCLEVKALTSCILARPRPGNGMCDCLRGNEGERDNDSDLCVREMWETTSKLQEIKKKTCQDKPNTPSFPDTHNYIISLRFITYLCTPTYITHPACFHMLYIRFSRIHHTVQ